MSPASASTPPVTSSPSASAVSIEPVRTRKERSAFVALPYRLHANEPNWCPPLRRDVARMLSAKTNPFFEHGEVELFLARCDGRIVGRVAAIENRAHNDFHADRVGFFGFFDCVDDAGVARALLDAAGEWLQGRGLEAMRGPCSLSTNDECGVLVQGFETTPTLLTPHTPEYYPALIEGAGLAKAKDLYLHLRRRTDVLPERLMRAAEVVARRKKVKLRPFRMDDFDGEIELIKKLYTGAWERNWGFVPMTDAELDHMAVELKPILEPSLICFAEADGEPCGFAVALLDFNQVLIKNRGGRFLPGIARVLLGRKSIDRVRILLLGLLPEFRGSGIDALLYQWVWTHAGYLGVDWGEAGWILEDNAAMNNALARMGFDHYRTLRLFERAL